MDAVLQGFLERNLPLVKDKIQITLTGRAGKERFCVSFADGRLHVEANSRVAAANGIFTYLQKVCRVNYSWCGNETLDIKALVPFDGKLEKVIDQQYRVYMNYCTLDYSMCWWDFARWEREIDFMAMNGINMPLCVIGTEAVWFETLLEFGFTESEALSTISGPAFYAWQLMTNIEGYMHPENKRYVYERLELGRRILARVLEFGMTPIQQGFSGHVPMLLREKRPEANIVPKNGWCLFPKTAQLDPLDPLFSEFGTAYLKRLDALLGNHHFLACDPFHEGTPPKKSWFYLRRVGQAIDALYRSFDADSTWVMQAWTLRKPIVKAVPKNRLLILDLNSERMKSTRNLWGYPAVAGMLHDFGGKNPMQGKLREHCKNPYYQRRRRGANTVGAGLFMEGIEQNPVVYDLQFRLLTESGPLDVSEFLDDYVERRYGGASRTLRQAWDILLATCYRDKGYQENGVGSTLCARPLMEPKKCGPCDVTKLFYDPAELEKALPLFLADSERFRSSDGYQYDVCDLTRQILSNRFHTNQAKFADAYRSKDAARAGSLAKEQMELLYDLDAFLGLRKNFTLARWINDSHKLAENDEERRYFDKNARTLVTVWGDLYGDNSMLYDYAWREWNGLISEYYAVRWKRFYDEALQALHDGKAFQTEAGVPVCGRPRFDATDFGRRLFEFEKSWCETYSEYDEPENRDVVDEAKRLAEKWRIGK